ncbi:MAG: hypothetical protein EXR68_01525 [Dehalococcoidia bacterium]|nr:hypothetical protein [Dehalococcoidia bacterium]
MSHSRRYVLFGVTAIAMLVSGLQNTMVFFASRASNPAAGLEVRYIVIAIACVLNMGLALGIPDKVGGGIAPAREASRRRATRTVVVVSSRLSASC